jgi:hypothetical protein
LAIGHLIALVSTITYIRTAVVCHA